MAKIKSNINGTKKDAILKNAATLFRTKGFKATSVRELADTLGIEAASLYNHIGSKVEMLQDICFEIAADYTNKMSEIKSIDCSAFVKTKMLIQFHIQKLYNDFDKVFVADHEWKQMPITFLQEFLAQRKMYESSFIAIIAEGIKNKEFKNIDAKITVLTILSAVRGLEFLQRKKNEFTLTALEDNMINLLLNGITI